MAQPSEAAQTEGGVRRCSRRASSQDRRPRPSHPAACTAPAGGGLAYSAKPGVAPRAAADAGTPKLGAPEPSHSALAAHPAGAAPGSRPAHPDSSGCSGSPWPVAGPAPAARPAAASLPRRRCPGVSAARADWPRPPPSRGPGCARGGRGPPPPLPRLPRAGASLNRARGCRSASSPGRRAAPPQPPACVTRPRRVL